MGYRTLDDLINDVGKTVPKSSKVHPLPLLFMLDTNDVVLMLPMRSVLVRYHLRWSVDGLGESRGTLFSSFTQALTPSSPSPSTLTPCVQL